MGEATGLRAAGFVLARVVEGTAQYLLLKSAAHGDWGFPKGHAEPGESDMQTARRELMEETGIDEVAVTEGFKQTVTYKVAGQIGDPIPKTVVYFLATTGRDDHVRSNEHDATGWFEYKQAQSLIRHEELRTLLAEADLALRE